jgi:hypothetical protein
MNFLFVVSKYKVISITLLLILNLGSPFYTIAQNTIIPNKFEGTWQTLDVVWGTDTRKIEIKNNKIKIFDDVFDIVKIIAVTESKYHYIIKKHKNYRVWHIFEPYHDRLVISSPINDKKYTNIDDIVREIDSISVIYPEIMWVNGFSMHLIREEAFKTVSKYSLSINTQKKEQLITYIIDNWQKNKLYELYSKKENVEKNTNIEDYNRILKWLYLEYCCVLNQVNPIETPKELKNMLAIHAIQSKEDKLLDKFYYFFFNKNIDRTDKNDKEMKIEKEEKKDR